MPTQDASTITTTLFKDRVQSATRVHRVRWTPDPPARQAALDFLAARGTVFANGVPPEVLAMPYGEAARHLEAHAYPQTLHAVYADRGGDPVIRDDDLRHLEHLPELPALHLFSTAVTDAGVRHLRHLRALERLMLVAPGLTDACVDDLAALTTLRTLDLMLCPGVSAAAFAGLCRRLPTLTRAWPSDAFEASRRRA